MTLSEQEGRRLRVKVHGKLVCDWLPFGNEDAAEQRVSLDTEFTVLQHAKPEPLTCELIIYNLTAQSREVMTAQQTRARETGWKAYQAIQSGATLVEEGGEAAAAASLVASTGLVEITAGYQDDIALLSRTQILAVNGINHVYNGVDWVTTIRSQDNRLPWQNAFVSSPVAPGISLRDVNRVLEASQQFLEGTLAEEAFTEQFPELLLKKPAAGFRNGFVLHGNPQQDASNIADTLRIEYYYLNGALVYTPKGSATSNVAVRLSKANNLLTAATGDRGFVTATTLLDHRIKPGRQVQLCEKNDITPIGGGIFRVDSVTHRGSNFDNAFNSVPILRPSVIDAKLNL